MNVFKTVWELGLAAVAVVMLAVLVCVLLDVVRMRRRNRL